MASPTQFVARTRILTRPLHVAEESFGVTNAAKDEHGLRWQLNAGCHSILARGQPFVTTQASRRREDRELREFLNGTFHRKLVIHSGENYQVRAMNRRKWFAKAATWE